MKKQILSIVALAAMSFGIVSCGETTDNETTVVDTMATAPMPTEEQGVMVGGANMVPSKNIVENAMNSNEHTTLVAAVKQAGLVETLSGPGPFTVFAPTNAAFGEVRDGKLENLMKEENKDKLVKVLTMHVVPGTFRAADLQDGMKLKTVEGKELKVQIKDGKVFVEGAEVTIPDVISSNGVTHVINEVIM